jgi:hypothetical protein
MNERPHDHPREDPVAWARAETVALTKRKLKRYGLLALGNSAAVRSTAALTRSSCKSALFLCSTLFIIQGNIKR